MVIRYSVKERIGKKGPATHFSGKNHIDIIWATNKLTVMQ